jgi:hypothetical protein
MTLPATAQPTISHLKFDSGRRKDFLWEDVFESSKDAFGIPSSDLIKSEIKKYLWADKNMATTIFAVDGVSYADVNGYYTRYLVCFDPRYDKEIVMKEIEATVLCCNNSQEETTA